MAAADRAQVVVRVLAADQVQVAGRVAAVDIREAAAVDTQAVAAHPIAAVTQEAAIPGEAAAAGTRAAADILVVDRLEVATAGTVDQVRRRAAKSHES